MTRYVLPVDLKKKPSARKKQGLFESIHYVVCFRKSRNHAKWFGRPFRSSLSAGRFGIPDRDSWNRNPCQTRTMDKIR